MTTKLTLVRHIRNVVTLQRSTNTRVNVLCTLEFVTILYGKRQELPYMMKALDWVAGLSSQGLTDDWGLALPISPSAYRVSSTYRQVSFARCSPHRVLPDKLSGRSLFRIQTTYRTEPPVIGLSGPNRWTRYTTGQGGRWNGHDKTKKGRKELVTLIRSTCTELPQLP